LYSKLKYLKNFCFKDAVRVEQIVITNEEEYTEKILMKNLFSNYNSTFCLLQQINLDSDEKYFIYGIKFNDIFIPDNVEFKDNNVKFFVIEKTYLFISNEPMFKLFENVVNFILVYKKVIFQKIIEFNSLLDKKVVSEFNELNKENVSSYLFIINFVYNRMIILNKFWIIFIIKNFQNQMNIFHMFLQLIKFLLNIIFQINMI
jgi:hypothetical protein